MDGYSVSASSPVSITYLIVRLRYPMVYCVLILPLSIVRWITFRQVATAGESHISAVATFFVSILFTLSGVLNTVMYLLTRTWFFLPQQRDELEAPSVEPVRT
jgi:hypothetical protein